MHPPFFLKDQKECAVHGGRKNLGGAYGAKLHRPAKAGAEFAGGLESVGGLYCAARVRRMLWSTATNVPPKTKRLLSTPCCRSVAVEGAVVSEDTPQAGRAAMGAVLGAGAADRTAISRAHRPSGCERSEAASSQAPYPSQQRKRRRSLIPLLVLFPREPLRLRSRGSPVATSGPPGSNPKQKTFLFHRPRRIFFFKENGGRQFPRRKAAEKAPPVCNTGICTAESAPYRYVLLNPWGSRAPRGSASSSPFLFRQMTSISGANSLSTCRHSPQGTQ